MQNDDISVNLFVRLDSTRYTTFLLPSSIHRLPLPLPPLPKFPTQPPLPIGARLNLTSAKFPVHGKRAALFFESGFRRVGLQSASTPFFFFLANPCRAYIYIHTYVRVTRTRSLSLSIFRGGRNEIGAIARFHLQSGTKLSMLNLIS